MNQHKTGEILMHCDYDDKQYLTHRVIGKTVEISGEILLQPYFIFTNIGGTFSEILMHQDLRSPAYAIPSDAVVIDFLTAEEVVKKTVQKNTMSIIKALEVKE